MDRAQKTNWLFAGFIVLMIAFSLSVSLLIFSLSHHFKSPLTNKNISLFDRQYTLDTEVIKYLQAVEELKRLQKQQAETFLQLEQNFSQIKQKIFDPQTMALAAMPAVVTLKSTDDKYVGTGMVVNNEGYIITTYHSLKDLQEFMSHFNDGRKIKAKLLFFDKTKDLALLKAESRQKFATLKLTDEVKIGEKIIVIQSLKGLEFTVTQGIVSGLRKEKDGATYIQTDAALNAGASGGPVINKKEELAGIITSKISTLEGVGFAINHNEIHSFLETKLP